MLNKADSKSNAQILFALCIVTPLPPPMVETPKKIEETPELKTTVLSIHAYASTDKVYLGRTISYDIVVTNEGDGPATSIIVEDTVPAMASVVNASQGATLLGSKVTWNVGTLQPQDSQKLTLTLNPSGIGIVKNMVKVKAANAASDTTIIMTEVIGIPSVDFEVSDLDDPIEVGDTVVYDIVVTNNGSDSATNIKIVCMLEDEMQYISSAGPTTGSVSADGKTVTFTLPTLNQNAKASWTVVIKALEEGDVRFKVTMFEDCLSRPIELTEATNFFK